MTTEKKYIVISDRNSWGVGSTLHDALNNAGARDCTVQVFILPKPDDKGAVTGYEISQIDGGVSVTYSPEIIASVPNEQRRELLRGSYFVADCLFMGGRYWLSDEPKEAQEFDSPDDEWVANWEDWLNYFVEGAPDDKARQKVAEIIEGAMYP